MDLVDAILVLIGLMTNAASEDAEEAQGLRHRLVLWALLGLWAAVAIGLTVWWLW